MGDFKLLYNICFRLVDTRWKDSKTLQFISSLRKLEKIEVTRRIGQELITVQCPTYITDYQHNMDLVDKGYQLFQHGAGFEIRITSKIGTGEGILGFVNFACLIFTLHGI